LGPFVGDPGPASLFGHQGERSGRLAQGPDVSLDVGNGSDPAPSVDRLRVLIADGPDVRLDEITKLIIDLGHEAFPRNASAEELAAFTRHQDVDVAIVIVTREPCTRCTRSTASCMRRPVR
jgi:hypothetical protein